MNIPDAGKVDDPPKPGKTEPVKAVPLVQDQPVESRLPSLHQEERLVLV